MSKRNKHIVSLGINQVWCTEYTARILMLHCKARVKGRKVPYKGNTHNDKIDRQNKLTSSIKTNYLRNWL